MNVAVSTESSSASIPPGNGVQQHSRDDEYRRRILNVQGKSMQYFPYLFIFFKME